MTVGPITWRRIVHDGLVLLGIIVAVAYWRYLTLVGGEPADVHAYWSADPRNLYDEALAGITADRYAYSPAFEFVVGWWRWVPFEIFAAIWRAIMLGLLVWMAGPFTVLVLLAMPVASEINAGNIQIALAAAIVVGFRHPAAWSFVLLTKLTPGIGLLWFALRRRRRDLAIVSGVTGSIALVSFALGPDRWFEYLAMIATSPPTSLPPYHLPLWVRLIPAIACIAWGGWTGSRWPVVVGATLALPIFFFISPSMLVGVLPFVREALGRRFGQGAGPRVVGA